MWGDVGGTCPRATSEAERRELWALLKDQYVDPGGTVSTGRYLAHGFRAEPGRRMLYVEDWC